MKLKIEHKEDIRAMAGILVDNGYVIKLNKVDVELDTEFYLEISEC